MHSLNKEQFIKALKERIESEHRKHPDLDWSEIAARKIYKGFIEPILEKNNGI